MQTRKLILHSRSTKTKLGGSNSEASILVLLYQSTHEILKNVRLFKLLFNITFYIIADCCRKIFGQLLFSIKMQSSTVYMHLKMRKIRPI